MREMKLFIPGNVPSLKNSKQIIQIPIKGSRPCPVCRHSAPESETYKCRQRRARCRDGWIRSYRSKLGQILSGTADARVVETVLRHLLGVIDIAEVDDDVSLHFFVDALEIE